MVNRSVSENDLHAFVDGHLTRERDREVVAYLATDPPAAERARAFFEQQEALAALRHSLAEDQAGPPESMQFASSYRLLLYRSPR